MKILDPERNTTKNIWKRLKYGADIQILSITTVMWAMPFIDDEILVYKVFSASAIGLMMILAIVNSYLQRKDVTELMKRYGETEKSKNKP